MVLHPEGTIGKNLILTVLRASTDIIAKKFRDWVFLVVETMFDLTYQTRS